MSTDGRRRHGESEFRTRSKLHRCSCRPDQNAWHLVDFWHTSRPYHKPTIHSVNTEYNYFAYYSDIVFWNHSCTPHINSQVPELYTLLNNGGERLGAGLANNRSRVESRPLHCGMQPWESCLHTCLCRQAV